MFRRYAHYYLDLRASELKINPQLILAAIGHDLIFKFSTIDEQTLKLTKNYVITGTSIENPAKHYYFLSENKSLSRQ